MVIFFVCVGLPILGYLICGSIVDLLFGVDRSRKTPAETIPDGAGYVKLSPWKFFLIQLINIAGLWSIYDPSRSEADSGFVKRSDIIRFCYRLTSLILGFAKPSDQGGVGMETKGIQGKLTAIFSAEVTGYCHPIQDDEAVIVKTLEAYKHDEPHGGYSEIGTPNLFGRLIVPDMLRKY